MPENPPQTFFTRLVLPAASLCRRDLVRFLRQRSRIIGALATPVLLWIVFGAGVGSSFRASVPGGGNFLEYFFVGTLIMILLFSAIFSEISVIEDRREGFLQSVLVSPVSPMAIVLGKVLGGTLLATGQAVLFMLLAPLIGISFSLVSFLAAIGVMLVVAFALNGLSFCIAWRMSSTQGFHVIMNLFLLPMFLLSGAMFPADGAARLMRLAMDLNPLTYGVSALRRAIYWSDAGALHLTGWTVSLGASLIFAAVMFLAASLISRGRVAADWQ